MLDTTLDAPAVAKETRLQQLRRALITPALSSRAAWCFAGLWLLAALVLIAIGHGTQAVLSSASLVGVPRDESAAVLRHLYELSEDPLFQCRFRWRENSVAFWDNRCTQHRAMWDYWPQTRSGFRVRVSRRGCPTIRPTPQGSASAAARNTQRGPWLYTTPWAMPRA